MRNTLSVYITAYVGLLLYVLALLYIYPKPELHLLLNSFHTHTVDTFFKYYSTLAEWPLYILALLPIIWKKIEITILFAMSEISGGIILQILKHFFSSDRPACVFERCHDMVLPVVDGVSLHHSNSFPSGHASTFFVFFTCIAIYLAYRYKKSGEHSRKKLILANLLMILLLILAVLGGYSRIYLSQHFLSDVCVGSIIGFITPFLFFHFAKDKIIQLKKYIENSKVKAQK